jgi:hypothetical protein
MAVGYSKQALHQKLDRQLTIEDECHNLLILVEQIRRDHPVISARKMYNMIMPATIGRDKFERLCLESGYGVERKRSFIRTTNSLGVTRFDNLIAGWELTGVTQVYVSDITYYRIAERFYYITLIMDLYSRKIKGYWASLNLLTSNTVIQALLMVRSQLNRGKAPGCIFHSDGGGQYYCKEFLILTSQMGMKNSMGYSVYENPHAERVIGTIKNDYLVHYGPTDFKELKRMLKKAVDNYNNRLHSKLGNLSPNEFEVLLQKGQCHPKMKISEFKQLNPFDLVHKDKADPSPVKDIINGRHPQASPRPSLTEAGSAFIKRLQDQKGKTNQKKKNYV